MYIQSCLVKVPYYIIQQTTLQCIVQGETTSPITSLLNFCALARGGSVG